MTTVLARTQAVQSGYWSIRDRIKLLEGELDATAPDAIIAILDDMYASVSDKPDSYMTIRLQNAVGCDVGLTMCDLIDKIPASDPRRSEQALKLIACLQTRAYDSRLHPIDKESIMSVNRAIGLLDPADPARINEALAHIDRIVNDPETERARMNSHYYGNHGYMYQAHRAWGVAEAVKLLPEGSDIKIGEAIKHLRYLGGEGAGYIKELGDFFGTTSENATQFVQSMLDAIPAEQHQTVIELAFAGQINKIIEGYEGGNKTASRVVLELATALSVLPKAEMNAEDSSLLVVSMAFAQAVQERHPLMLEPDHRGDVREGGRHLAFLWQQVALRTGVGEVVTDRVSANAQTVTFYPQVRSFEFGGQQ